jgi:AcrR family transcriptional regulator
MPKGFTEREKTIIRAKLLEKGRECLVTYGIRKTNIEDLTDAAGISKGAFYLFFESKETLFFEIFGQFEDEYQTRLLDVAAQPGESPRDVVKHYLRSAFSIWRAHPLFTRFDQAEFEYLVRKLPEEVVQANARKDEVFIDRLFEQWRGRGIDLDCSPGLFFGLTRALFFVSLRADEIGPENYSAVIELLIDVIVDRIVRE